MTKIKYRWVKCPVCGRHQRTKGKEYFRCCGVQHRIADHLLYPDRSKELGSDSPMTGGGAPEAPSARHKAEVLDLKEPLRCPDCGGTNIIPREEFKKKHPDLNVPPGTWACEDCMEVW